MLGSAPGIVVRIVTSGAHGVAINDISGSIELPDAGARTVFLVTSDVADPPYEVIVSEDRGSSSVRPPR